jgi:HEAT repeat protein
MPPTSKRLARLDADILASAGVKSVSGLLDVLATTDDTRLVLIACWYVPRISRVPRSSAVRSLAKLLASSLVAIRRSAAVALGELGSKRATSFLLTASSDPEPAVRMSAIYAIGKLADRRGRERLLSVLNDAKEDARVRAAAAESLGSLGDSSVGPALLRHMGDPSPEVRLFCASALGELRDRRALRALRRARHDRGRVRVHGSVGKAARSAVAAIERDRS